MLKMYCVPLVDPAAVFGEGIQLIVGDKIGLQVLLPVPNTLQIDSKYSSGRFQPLVFSFSNLIKL